MSKFQTASRIGAAGQRNQSPDDLLRTNHGQRIEEVLRMEGMLRIGLIADTHGLLRQQALDALAGSDHIIHAGDIGGPEIVARLQEIAPLTTVRGNNDADAWGRTLPETALLRLPRLAILVLHDLADLARETEEMPDVVVCGHSHRPRIERHGPLLVVNPGSAGPRRFRLPVSVGRLHIAADGRCEPEIVSLDVR